MGYARRQACSFDCVVYFESKRTRHLSVYVVTNRKKQGANAKKLGTDGKNLEADPELAVLSTYGHSQKKSCAKLSTGGGSARSHGCRKKSEVLSVKDMGKSV